MAIVSGFFILFLIISSSFPKFRAHLNYGDLIFFQSIRDKYTLFYSIKTSASHVAFQIFKVSIMPENVGPNLSKFVGSLYNLKIPFSYQVESLPAMYSQENNNNRRNRKYPSVKDLPISISIYFTVFAKKKGFLFPWKIYTMIKQVNEYANALRMAFFANFHHYKIDRLDGSQVISTIAGNLENRSFHYYSSSKWMVSLVFRLFTLLISGTWLFALLLLLVGTGWVILICSMLILSFILLFFRDAYFFCNKLFLSLKSKSLIQSHPLGKVKIAKPSRIGNTVQIFFGRGYVALYRNYSLKFAQQPLHRRSDRDEKIHALFSVDKFYEALVSGNLFFTVTSTSLPLNYNKFLKESEPFLKERTKNLLSRFENPSEKKSFLEARLGIWKTIMNFSIYSFRTIQELSEETMRNMLQEIEDNAISLKNTFHMNLNAFELEEVPMKKLETAFLTERLKNSQIPELGTGMNYLIFQGATLSRLNYLSSHFRKGIDTRIASEFISPIHLPNQVIIGDVLETEHFNEETRFGFTLNQTNNLLITNGSKRLRQAALMKIVAELTVQDRSCIVFDHVGNWSVLIKLFQDTDYSTRFVYYKLGDMFRLHYNLTAISKKPDILRFNAEYMNIFCDAFELAYQQKHFNPDIAKEMLLSNESDVSTEATRLQHAPPWEKPLGKDLIMNLQQLKQESNFFVGKGEISHEENMLRNAIYSNKTVIIDLSGSNDLKIRLFAQYLTLAKIIYNLKNEPSETKKTILLPRGDSFFTDHFIVNNRYDYKVVNFLEPLLNYEFGFIATANQIRYCHTSFLNYFTNIMAFRTFDHHDIKKLVDLMNMNILHGMGVYSTSRNETFQTHFLKNLDSNEYECIVKRDDNSQPFPVKLNLSKFINSDPMSKQEIYAYMKAQGYQPERIRDLIRKSSEKSLFETHFKPYAVLIPDLIKFLTAIKRQEAIGNLYESQLKAELLKFIINTVSKITQDKKVIKKIRDEIFGKMHTHRYLIKHSVTTAAGSESIRSSYKVGEQFEVSLSEYMQKQEAINQPTGLELIERESDNSTINKKLEKSPQFKDISDPKLKISRDNDSSSQIDPLSMRIYLSQENEVLITNLLEIFKAIRAKRYRDALQLEKVMLRKFFRNIYKRVFHDDKVLISEDIQTLVQHMQAVISFPYNASQVMELMSTIDNVNPHLEPTENIVTELYEKLTIFQLNVNKVLN